jgi:hypothetical protein
MSPQPIEQSVSDAIETGAGEPSQSASFWRRTFGRHMMDMAVLLLIVVAFSGLRTPEHLLGDPDIWWHFADARILATTHHFIHVEPYSFTVAGQPWVNPEWLSEVPFWLGYSSFGMVGVYLVTLFALCANVYFLYWRCRLKPANPGVALWMAALGFVLMWVNAGARTIVIAYLALSAEMAILEAVERGRKRQLWLLPPLFCIWINLHGSWIIGLAILVLYIACGMIRANVGLFEQEAFSGTDRNRLFAVLGASVAALFINPYGWRLLWNPIDMAVNQKLNISNVLEWQPLNLGWFVGKAAFVSIVLMVVANAVNGRKWKIYEFALVFFAWYAAFNHARFTFLAAILTVPMLSADLTRSFFPMAEQKTIPAMNALIAVGAIAVIAWYLPTSQQMQTGLTEGLPLKLIASVQPGWRTLNQEHIGGIMDFNSRPTFIDTRWDTFEHHGVMQDYIDILHSHDSLKLLDKYRIDHVFLRQEEGLVYLLERTPGWKVVGKEGTGHEQYELIQRVNANGAASPDCAASTVPAHP